MKKSQKTSLGILRVKAEDRKRYVLKEKRDYEILGIIYFLERHKLSREDKRLVNLIRTQLEDDWRKPLLRTLSEIVKKYK